MLYRARFVAVATLLSSVFLLPGCNELSVSDAIEKLGFQRFQPPRASIQPGTLVVIEKHSGESIVSPVCWKEQAFPGLADPKPNPSIEQQIAKTVKQELNLEAGYLEKIKAQAKFGRVKDITLKLTNTSVPEYSDADMYAAFPSRLPACEQAVKAREDNNQIVYTAIQVIQADVTYMVKTDSSAGAGASLPPEILEDLKVELGGSIVNQLDQSISGMGLTWGLKPDIIALRRAPGGIAGVTIPAARLSEDARDSLVGVAAAMTDTMSDADKILQGR